MAHIVYTAKYPTDMLYLRKPTAMCLPNIQSASVLCLFSIMRCFAHSTASGWGPGVGSARAAPSHKHNGETAISPSHAHCLTL